jgi:zinc and cadmium transporter
MIEILLASLAVMTASLVGVVSIWKWAGATIERNLHFLISFSAGVFIIIIFGLSQEALEHAPDLSSGLFWIFFGALFIWVLSKLLPAIHTHPDEHGHHHQSIDVRRVLMSDGVHNIGDGILLAASFAVSPILGITAAASIFVHELLQEISEFFILRDAGLSVGRALMINFAVSSTILIGAIGGFFLLDVFEMIEAPLLGIAAGAFLVVVLHDLIPHSVRDVRKPIHFMMHLGWFLLGAVLMFGVSTLAPHEEPEHAESAHQEEGINGVV